MTGFARGALLAAAAIGTAAGGAALVGAALVGTASAHHSTAAFNSERVIRIEGEVKSFRWINPHASIKIEGAVPDDDMIDGLWTVEMTAPNVLIRQGWRRNSVQEGDHVTMFVNPLHNPVTLNDGSQGSLYVGVILADGSTLGRTDGAGAGTDE